MQCDMWLRGSDWGSPSKASSVDCRRRCYNKPNQREDQQGVVIVEIGKGSRPIPYQTMQIVETVQDVEAFCSIPWAALGFW